MSRFTRTVSADGATGGGGHTTHCLYEWELLANCIEWDCCYSGELEILVCPSLFNAFKIELNGMVLNCSGGTSNWFTPKFSVSLLTIDQLKLLKYDNIVSKKYKTNFDFKMNANRKFEDEINRYSFNWTSGGQFSKKEF